MIPRAAASAIADRSAASPAPHASISSSTRADRRLEPEPVVLLQRSGDAGHPQQPERGAVQPAVVGVATGEDHGDVTGDGVQLGDRTEPVPRSRPVPETADQARLSPVSPARWSATRRVTSSGPVVPARSTVVRVRDHVVRCTWWSHSPGMAHRPAASTTSGGDGGQVRTHLGDHPSAIRRSTGRSSEPAARIPGPTGHEARPTDQHVVRRTGRGLMGRVCWVGRRAARAPARSAAPGSGPPWRPRRRGRPRLRRPGPRRSSRTPRRSRASSR